MRLAGKVAIVTGGGSGIGRAIVLAYAREGCRVLSVDRRPSVFDGTAAAAPGEVRSLVADVAEPDGARDVVAAARTDWGRLDVLVNSAAVQLHGEDARCHEVPDHVWQETLRVNLGGPFLVSRAAIPEMLRGGGGSIVNIASPTGLLGRGAGYTAYSTSKGGLISLTRVIAIGYAREGIRCNAIVPGPTETPLIADLLRDPAQRARLAATPMGRIGHPEDLAGIATYLASDESAFATGALFTVDGGWTVM